MLLELKNIHFTYPPRFILQNINFTLKPGQRILLQGPNGSGKSTLLNLLAGLLSPNEGTIIHEPGPAEIALARHNPSLYPQLTVRQNLDFWLKLEHSLAKKEPLNQATPEDMLLQMGLLTVADHKASTLSRGMAQRLDLTRIILSRAKLILLDEPENSLEQKYLELFAESILTKTQTIVWASHTLPPNFTLHSTPLFSHHLQLEESTENIGVFNGQLQPIEGTPC